jgi:NAD(P)-dependent dehydrogenase (short-subunit alcohol dehydrogenase family)
VRGLADKVAVVAGGARGLGAATAERLAAEGARVVVGDIEADGAKATAARIEAAGGAALAVPFDIVDETSVRALIAAAVDGFGGVDLLHNVAADLSDRTLRRDTDAVDIDVAVWDRTMTVNLRGFLLTVKAAVPEMLRRGGGAIVNTSSAASFMGEAQRPAYAVAKAGVNALTRHVASRWGKENIRCNAVAPGVILTEALKSGPQSSELQRRILKAVRVPRLGEPDDIASMVAFLLSDEAAYINGQVLSVDGGITMR